jgi:hypothetical protein
MHHKSCLETSKVWSKGFMAMDIVGGRKRDKVQLFVDCLPFHIRKIPTLLEDDKCEEGMVLSMIGASNDTNETIDAMGLKKDIS